MDLVLRSHAGSFGDARAGSIDAKAAHRASRLNCLSSIVFLTRGKAATRHRIHKIARSFNFYFCAARRHPAGHEAGCGGFKRVCCSIDFLPGT
ncbi:hypothetical protein ACS15_1669 [Ralstonia insidiosa]|uniref:Uncharacterized protein n=1 Tax=Ralstonia insidiosa TaxID=190721 RepID=A0AAC9FTF1_9RALS|nr:hypothetical protein ACS15_1669 [Ralstonia insidiosa]